jgi:hypothetical protein
MSRAQALGKAGARPGSRAHAGGVEICSSSKHARQVTALHQRQLAVHIAEARGGVRPGLREGGMGGEAE